MRSALFAGAAAVLLLAGCASPVAQKTGTGELRTDLEPLTSRFEALTDATGAQWASGTFGEERVPGPSLYWIDAVVTLDAATEAHLRGLDLTPADAPELARPLDSSLTDGAWLSGDTLDALFSPEGYATTAFLAEESPTVILQSVFE